MRGLLEDDSMSETLYHGNRASHGNKVPKENKIFFKLLETYTPSELTFISDLGSAFDGIMNYLKIYNMDCVYGVPLRWAPFALLWSHY